MRPGGVLSSAPEEDTPGPPLPTHLYVCLSQVNGVNVVKVGHKQVVALIRQGGNRLVMKVVSVTRKPEEDGARRRGEGSGFRPLCPLAPDLRPLTPGQCSSAHPLTPDPRQLTSDA